MPPPGARKHAKARRRAITKFINSASTPSTSGTTAEKASTNGDSDTTAKGGATHSSSTDKGASSSKSATSAVQSSSTVPSSSGRDPPMPSTSKRDSPNYPSCPSSMIASSSWRCDMMWSTKGDGASRERKVSLVDGQTDNRKNICAVCACPSTGSCSACGKVFYCGKIHQKKDWNDGHKLVCNPFEEMNVEECEGQKGPLGKGPYLKASRDLHPMEKIYEDQPIMTGPGCCADLLYEPLCLGCTDRIEGSQKCSKCNWPLCGPKCEEDTLHATYECEIFAENEVEELEDSFQYELVRILRCLLTKNKDPEKFSQLMDLEGALEERTKIESLIEATKTVCMFVKENCKLTEFDDETINHMCGVVDLQTQVSGKDRSAMQIYEFPTKLLHSCSANTRFLEIIQPNGQNALQVVAVKPIRRGEPLTQRLVISLEPTYERQRFLLEHFYFHCKCSLCKDATERGTNFSAVKCPLCDEGKEDLAARDPYQNLHYVLPKVPTDLQCNWRCNFCRTEFVSTMMLPKLDACESMYWNFKYGKLQGMKERDKIIAVREKIGELEREYHPNNFFVWRLKQLLFNKLTEHILLIYPPKSWNEFREMYAEIEELACCVMATVHVLQPGFTLIRGRSLHDLVTAYWAYIQWAVLFGKASSFNNHRDSNEFYRLVEDTVAIFEPEITDVKRIIDSVIFMRDHTEEIRARVEYLGKLSSFEEVSDYTEDIYKIRKGAVGATDPK